MSSPEHLNIQTNETPDPEKEERISTLKQQLADIKTRATEMVEEVRRNSDTTLSDTDRARIEALISQGQEIKKEIQKLEGIQSIIAKYTNPEGQAETIEIDIEKQLEEQIQFYKDEDIDIPTDFENQIRDLWNNNQDKIRESMEQQGFDHVLLIPPHNTQDINDKTTKDYTETKEWVPISEIKDTKPNQTRLVLVHKDNAQNLERPDLAKTKNKSIYDLCNATTDQEKENIDELIKTNQPLPIDGLTFGEYLILDRQYFKETGRHLDEKTWTWLSQSTKGSSVVYSNWFLDDSRVDVDSLSPVHSDSLRGLRSSRTIL